MIGFVGATAVVGGGCPGSAERRVCKRTRAVRCVRMSISQDAEKEAEKQALLKDMRGAGLLPLIPDIITLPAYTFMAIRFYQGFEFTNYSSQFRIPLAIVWPALLFSGKSRKNLTRAIKASDD